MKELLTFDDVLITPKFSTITSRKDVDLTSSPDGLPYLRLPIISANMDSVTGPEMARAMLKGGGIGCLHRFCSIEDNVTMFKDSYLVEPRDRMGPQLPMVSIGLGNAELERAEALSHAGAYTVVIDVAHGASMSVVNQVKELRKLFKKDLSIIVGNFATADSVEDFMHHLDGGYEIEGIKVGIGPGSACSTRTQTGCGYPQLSAILEISEVLFDTNISVIADGGMKNSGDVAKALAAGAHMVMSGSFFAGTDESPGEKVWKSKGFYYPEKSVYPVRMTDGLQVLDKTYPIDLPAFKKYRGSASKESYEAQGKEAQWRTAEGEAFYVPYKGSVKDILQNIEGGLRSAFSYVGATNLKEFQEKAQFVRVSGAGYFEGTPHGKKS